jgi:regulatory protein
LKNSETDELEKAFASALRTLVRRDHSVAELERKLCTRGYPADIVAQVIARLSACGYLDDRRFAEQWADSAVRNGRGYGPRLRLELNRRGVPRDIVADVVAGLSAAYGEKETLARIVARKYAGFDPQAASDGDRRRVVAYLQRRGFSISAIFDFLRRIPED